MKALNPVSQRCAALLVLIWSGTGQASEAQQQALRQLESAQLGGKHSGSYFAAARSGEGAVVEIGTVGTRKVLFLTWYTYFQGQQRWLVGSVDLAAGATNAVIPLFVTSGG